jgi:uncharacterized membrane protein
VPIDAIHYGIGRWLHILFGMMWVGLLYYFNFVQVEAMRRAGADMPPTNAGIVRHVVPRALAYFRYASIGTVAMGFALLADRAADVLLFRVVGYIPIGIGAWLGVIMFFNVWVLIWPNQKKVLGLVSASEDEKARARRVAFLASRVNVVLSLPMLFFMVSSGNLFYARMF